MEIKHIIDKILSCFLYESTETRKRVNLELKKYIRENSATVIDLKTDDEVKQFADQWAKNYRKRIYNHLNS